MMIDKVKLFKFVGVGIVNTGFGYGVFFLFVFMGIPYLAALFAATVVGVIFNYNSFGRVVFNGVGGRSVFIRFVVAYGIVYAINAALLWLLVDRLMLTPYVGQIVCIPLMVLSAWLLMNHWVFEGNTRDE